MTTSKRMFFALVSVLSAVGLIATLPLSALAQEETLRDDAAAETSPANPINDEEMMMEGDVDTDTDMMMEGDVDADTDTDMMMESDIDTDTDMMTGDSDDDDDMMMESDINTDTDMMTGDSDDDDDMMMTSPAVSNSPRALW